MSNIEFKIGDKVTLLLPVPDEEMTRTTTVLSGKVGIVIRECDGKYLINMVEVLFIINNISVPYYIAKRRLKHAVHNINIMEDGG